MQQVRDRAVSTRLPRAIPASPAQARSVSHGDATYELRVQKGPSHDATRRRRAQKAHIGPRALCCCAARRRRAAPKSWLRGPLAALREGQPPPGARSARKWSNSANRMPSEQRPMGAGAVCNRGGLAACKTLASKNASAARGPEHEQERRTKTAGVAKRQTRETAYRPLRGSRRGPNDTGAPPRRPPTSNRTVAERTETPPQLEALAVADPRATRRSCLA